MKIIEFRESGKIGVVFEDGEIVAVNKEAS